MGVGGGGGASKVCAQKASSIGESQSCQDKQAAVQRPTADLVVSASIPGWPAFVGAGAAIGGLGFEPPTCRFVVGCFTPRPLRVL